MPLMTTVPQSIESSRARSAEAVLLPEPEARDHGNTSPALTRGRRLSDLDRQPTFSVVL